VLYGKYRKTIENVADNRFIFLGKNRCESLKAKFREELAKN
jgi:hypothetical protein